MYAQKERGWMLDSFGLLALFWGACLRLTMPGHGHHHSATEAISGYRPFFQSQCKCFFLEDRKKEKKKTNILGTLPNQPLVPESMHHHLLFCFIHSLSYRGALRYDSFRIFNTAARVFHDQRQRHFRNKNVLCQGLVVNGKKPNLRIRPTVQ